MPNLLQILINKNVWDSSDKRYNPIWHTAVEDIFLSLCFIIPFCIICFFLGELSGENIYSIILSPIVAIKHYNALTYFLNKKPTTYQIASQFLIPWSPLIVLMIVDKALNLNIACYIQDIIATLYLGAVGIVVGRRIDKNRLEKAAKNAEN
tara:strand:+ start:111821 stop:112273 length:453 start_codon:yes stop_codon:yes gene_type:complete